MQNKLVIDIPMTKVGSIISDMHNGAFEAKQWYYELKKGYLDYLDELKILDFVVITGDFFNHKISMNSEHAKYALKFLTELIKICEKKGTKLRIIKGTESHDNQQLDSFEAISKKSKCDFRIIQTVETEWLFEDMYVLYIPEEYMTDKDDYYKDYFNQEYDMIFGHGMIHEALVVASKQESENTMSRAPIFKSEELLSICKGPIFFGHIHKHMILKGRFYYVNSFSRWAFGEEEDKGFCMCFYVPSTSDFKVEFIVNNYARRFDTISIDFGKDMTGVNEQEQVDYLVKLAQSLVIDYLRLEIFIPEDYPNPNYLTGLLNAVFANYKKLKLKIVNNTKLKQKKEIDETINKLLNRYDFIFDKSLTYEEKLSKFIKEKNNRNIPVESIRKYLYDNITGKGA